MSGKVEIYPAVDELGELLPLAWDIHVDGLPVLTKIANPITAVQEFLRDNAISPSVIFLYPKAEVVP